jgi:hypothetical protein
MNQRDKCIQANMLKLRWEHIEMLGGEQALSSESSSGPDDGNAAASAVATGAGAGGAVVVLCLLLIWQRRKLGEKWNREHSAPNKQSEGKETKSGELMVSNPAEPAGTLGHQMHHNPMMFNQNPMHQKSSPALRKQQLSGPSRLTPPSEAPVNVTKAYDVFLSYRVSADQDLVERLYDKLTAKGLHVFWDYQCLESGTDWQSNFLHCLSQSSCFVPVLSKTALGSMVDIKEDSVDNLFLELSLALELAYHDRIDRVCPVLLGSLVKTRSFSADPSTEGALRNEYLDFFAEGGMPKTGNTVPKTVNKKIKKVLAAFDLKPSPGFQRRTVTGTLNMVTSNQGIFIKGLESTKPIKTAVDQIVTMCAKLPHFDSSLISESRDRGSTSASTGSASSWVSLESSTSPGRSKVKTQFSREYSGSVDTVNKEGNGNAAAAAGDARAGAAAGGEAGDTPADADAPAYDASCEAAGEVADYQAPDADAAAAGGGGGSGGGGGGGVGSGSGGVDDNDGGVDDNEGGVDDNEGGW